MIRGAETAGWAATAAAVIGLHLLLAGLLMPRPPAEAAAAGDPIFVDLLPADAPAEHPAGEPSPQPLPAEPPADPAPPPVAADAAPPEAADPAPDQPMLAAPGFTPPQMNLLPALDDPAALFAPPVSALRLAASERPDPRPARSPVVRAQPQPEPRQAQAPARQDSRAAAARPAQAAPKAPGKTAAAAASKSAGQPAATGRDAPSRQQIAGWQAEIRTRISRHMSRTRFSGGGGRGTVQVQIAITIRANGAAAARLTSSTGDPRYDSALAGQAARMPRMPAPPVPQDYSFALPVNVRAR